jgi:hypothetical protein
VSQAKWKDPFHFDDAWFQEFSQENLYDAHSDELTFCIRTRISTFGSYLLSFVASLAAITFALIWPPGWKIPVAVVLTIVPVYYGRKCVAALHGTVHLYDYDKCIALRNALENKRRNEQQETQNEYAKRYSSGIDLDVCFSILGIERSIATRQKIDKAFGQAALKHHPDKNANDPLADRKFKIVKRAYEILIEVYK